MMPSQGASWPSSELEWRQRISSEYLASHPRTRDILEVKPADTSLYVITFLDYNEYRDPYTRTFKIVNDASQAFSMTLEWWAQQKRAAYGDPLITEGPLRALRTAHEVSLPLKQTPKLC